MTPFVDGVENHGGIDQSGDDATNNQNQNDVPKRLAETKPLQCANSNKEPEHALILLPHLLLPL
jgi:hypothetical protein